MLAETIKQEGNYFNILMKYLFFLLLGLIITGIIFYYLNPKIFNISLSYSIIIGYFIIYWAISITFFLYQIAIFRSQEYVVARITIENLFIFSILLVLIYLIGIKLIHFIGLILFLIIGQIIRIGLQVFKNEKIASN
jgi:hypothetical protein